MIARSRGSTPSTWIVSLGFNTNRLLLWFMRPMVSRISSLAPWLFALMLGIALTGLSLPLLNAQLVPATTRKQDFRPISLRDLQRSGSLVNKDPRQLIYRLFASTDEFPRSETLHIDYEGGEGKHAAIAIFTKSGLLGDSVRAQRYYIELKRQSDGQWQLIWAGSQNQCSEGRGSQFWTSQLCS